MTTRVDWVRLGSLADHERLLAASARVQGERRSLERSLTRSAPQAFSVPARCWVCQRDVELAVDYRWAIAGESGPEPNWREHLCCPSCGLNNRMRATVHFLAECVGATPESRVYLTEQKTGLFGVMEARHPRLVSSEYLGEAMELGQLTPSAIRNEDITRLSFPDALFDLIVTLDVLEHVPDTRRALAELRRVLRPGGSLVISVPFDPLRESHLVRAAVDAHGRIQHFLPPEYHYDPIRPEGCLAFYRFGWQLLEDLRAAGFATADAFAYWSDAFGYLGSSSFLFLARVAPEATDDLAVERFVPSLGAPGIELEARVRGAPSLEALRGEARFLEAQLSQLQVRERGASSELARVRVDLQWCYERLLEREAELSSIHSSKTWRLWMAYLALRGLVLRPVQRVRRSVAGAAKWLGSAAPRGLGWLHLVFWAAGAWTAAALRGPVAGGVAGAEPPAAPSTTRRPRVLVVCPYRLHPPTHGGAVRILNLLRRLGTTCDLQLFVFHEDDDDAEQRWVLASLVEKLYVHRWRPQWRPDRLGLKPKPVQLFESPEVRQRLNDILAAERIDILQLEYTEMGQYGMPPFARVKVVLTEIDVAFRAFARRRRAGLPERYRSNRMLGQSWADWARLFRYELKAVRRADQVHVMSEADAAYLRRFVPAAAGKMVVVPNGVDLDEYRPSSRAGRRDRRLLFLGNFQHVPNIDALEYLLLEIWPIVRQRLPDAELLVVGARPPEEVRRHQGVPGVTLVGEVEDTRPHYQTCRALLAPIRAGSGTRLKILEALACGAPVVTTTLGAEGIEGSDGVHFLIGDTPERFADAVCRLLADDALCDRLAEQGRRLVEERYGWDRSAAAARAAYERLLPARPAADGGQVAESVQGDADAIDAPDISVVIPTRQGGAGLARCLAAIGGQTTRRTVEVLCVDSGSSDADLRMMREHGARIVRVDGGDFDHGLTRDLGARESRGRVLVFLNQDAVPTDPWWLDRLTDPLFAPGGPAAVQGGILEVPESRQRFYWTSCGPRFYFTKESRRWIERYYGIGFSTVNAAIRREVWERHPFGRAPIMEDKKWQRDAVAAGHAIGLAPEASVYHTHDYAWRALLRRCYSEGIGWRLVGERYSFADMVTDLCQPEMLAELWRGMRRREVHTWAEALFPVLRPVMLFRGHRWGRTVRL